MKRIIREKQQGSLVWLRTDGLIAYGNQEISVSVDQNAESEAEEFLLYAADYVLAGAHLRAEETMAYGYWLVKFRLRNESALEAWEYNADATDFVPGANRTLQYWKDQHAVCESKKAAFSPPRPDKLTVVSKGVLDGLSVQGVRYPSPDHMSGWWITTDLYDGDITSLNHEHTYHLTSLRPDLAKYLALPEGYRFDLSSGEDVWKDEKVLASV